MKGARLIPDENRPNVAPDLATAAIAMHEMYTSLVNAGFTEQQALWLVGQQVRSGQSEQP